MNHEIADNPILCPDCGHDIDRHESDEPCWECFYEWDDSDGPNGPHFCKLRPSDIARALLDAEPTEAEVEAASLAVRHERAFMAAAAFGVPLDAVPECAELIARAALQAAREARA